MEGVEKCSSGSASMDGTTTIDVDGIAFLAKWLNDDGTMKTNVLRIILSPERHCCGRGGLVGGIWGCGW